MKTKAANVRRLKIISRKALKISQPSNRDLFLLTLTGQELLDVAGISRVERDDAGRLIGYQRPEVKKHVRDIAQYLQSADMILAHPLILSFDSTVRFVSSRGQKTSDGLAVAGMLEIRMPEAGKTKPAWIVDGQQRALAISLCADRSFAVPVCAFVADDVEIQRDQFLRINNSRPLPRGLVTELLPEVSTNLPANLSLRRIPAALCDLLNRDEASPFRGLIKRASTSAANRSSCVITDTVIIKMIEESLTQASGCLFPYRNIATGECDIDAVWTLLLAYWGAVRDTFPEAWGRPPTESRLMHGVGIRAMGKLMDRILSTVERSTKDARCQIRKELSSVAPFCRWTAGEWEELGGIQYNELQNVNKHLSMVSNFLVRKYLEQSQRR
jgi:DGQHR domain-containing protein